MGWKVMLTTLVGCVIIEAAVLAQTVQPVPQIRVLGARLISEAKSDFLGTSWSSQNYQRTGLAITVEISFSGTNFAAQTSDFFIEYYLSDAGPFSSECIGITSDSLPETGNWSYLFSPGDKAFVLLNHGKGDVILLCPVSKQIKTFTLCYRHPTVFAKGSVGK